MQYKLINLISHGDFRGNLIAFEKGVNCPFPIKRCFYIYDTKSNEVVRGAHANKKSEFLLVVISGSCKVRVDTGSGKETFSLNSPMQALYLDKMVWKEMFDFSHNSILLVLSNELYDESEYIRNYDEFLRIAK